MSYYEFFGPMGGRGGGMPMGGRGGGMPMGGRGGGMLPPRHFGPHYFHPKPRYDTQYIYPYNYYYPYYYHYPYYSYPYSYYLIDDTEEKCFCMDPQYKDLQVCVDGRCGACIRKSLCSECDDKISCKKE